VEIGYGDGTTAALRAEMDALFEAQNKTPGQAITSIPATFLRVTVTRP